MSLIAQQYAPLARRTLKELPVQQHLIHMSLGVIGEVGELIDALKKHAIYGKALDKVNLTEEVGDVLWYVANLLPELNVQPEVLQRALDDGFQQGTMRRNELGAVADDTMRTFMLCHDALGLGFGMATAVNGGILMPGLVPGSSNALRTIESLGGLVGAVCGVLDLDAGQAMRLNIEKLAKRYGDKYTDYAALNRDTAAERTVLEGGWHSGHEKPVVAGTYERQYEDGVFEDSWTGEKWTSAQHGDVHPSLPWRAKNSNVVNFPGANLSALATAPTGGLNLDSDKPLEGGSCSVDGPCEGCQ